MTRTYEITPRSKWSRAAFTLKLIEAGECRDTQPHAHEIEAKAAGFCWVLGRGL